jgi:hypothetical protein
MERRLAAVVIADVAGYGRLSQADEEGTRARFQADLNEVFARPSSRITPRDLISVQRSLEEVSLPPRR